MIRCGWCDQLTSARDSCSYCGRDPVQPWALRTIIQNAWGPGQNMWETVVSNSTTVVDVTSTSINRVRGLVGRRS